MTIAPRPSAPPKPVTLAEFGALIGDPARAAILLHLSDGSRRPAGELAALAGLSPQALTRHLARLVDGGLLQAEPQGRHRFFRIASGEAAEALEALANWIDEPHRTCRHEPALRQARLCYDHLAGRLGVLLYERMVARGLVALTPEGPLLSAAGGAWCDRHGFALRETPGSRRPLLRLCLDWTERRPHLGGRLGAAIASALLDRGCVTPGQRRRTLMVTAAGSTFLRDEFGVDLASAEARGGGVR